MEELDRIDGATPDAWILTFSGRHIDFLHPVPDEIRIGDIARGLSRACRFAGQTRTFYSVAQHSVLASRIVPEAFALEALLHDASEAFLCAIPAPLKNRLPEYVRIEKILDRAIRKRFGIPEAPGEPVKLADRILLATEKRDLMAPDSRPWTCLEGIAPLPNPIVSWSESVALERFLERFSELSGAVDAA